MVIRLMIIFLNLIHPTPFSTLEKGEKTYFKVGLSSLSKMERGFRGEVYSTDTEDKHARYCAL